MEYFKIDDSNYQSFKCLAYDYYKDGEDAETPDDDIYAFIRTLFEMIDFRQIFGYLAYIGKQAAGFCIWGIDGEHFPFSEMRGYGTIMEIGIVKSMQRKGLGKEFVSYIEADMSNNGVDKCYVSAYGKALKFWSLCDYEAIGKTAGNGLPLMTKENLI